MSETLFPSEEDLQRASRGAARGAVDDALASFGSEGEPAGDVRPAGTPVRTAARRPPIERKILGAEVVLPADRPIAAAGSRRPQILMMLRIAAAVVLGALLGLSYERYRMPSSPAATSAAEAQPPQTAAAYEPTASRTSTPAADAALPSAQGALPSRVSAAGGIIQARGPSANGRPAGLADNIEETLVRRLLNAYARAYDRLDVAAASDLWPGVDRRALSGVFASVRSQRVTLDPCVIAIAGDRATAQCAGVIHFIPRIGDPHPESRDINWSFDLRRSSGHWRIANTNAR